MFRRKRNQPSSPAASGAGRQPNDEYARILGRVPLFLDLSKRELQRISFDAVMRSYAAGEELVQQGAPNMALFVLVSGRVRVTARPEDGGDTRELAVMGPGEVVGEMALLDDQRRSATVTALEPTQALVVPFQDFRLALREDPDITIKLLAVVSRRLRQAETRGY
jgi:CRP/FNR family transcriptional regulator, cyclic AMP receptor protein